MNETQRAAAERLVDNMNLSLETWIEQAENLLRELAAEPVQEATPDDMKVYDAIAANYAAPQQQTEPVQDIQKALKDAQHTADFYRRRCEALQQWQSRMRDPERTVVCDILANGFTLDPPIPHNRYALPAEPVQEPKPTTASQFESVKEAKRAAEYELRYYRKMMDEKNAADPQGEPVAHLYVGADYGEELQDWEIDAEQGMCDKLNEQYYCNPQKLPLYTHPPQQPMHCPKDGGECGAGGYCRPEQRKPLTPSMQAEVECDCLVAWNASTYGHSAQDTVHPMFLSAFLSGYRAAERAHDITGEPT